jgi:ribosomal protein L11
MTMIAISVGTAAVAAATGVGTAISGNAAATKKRNFEQNLAALSFDQQALLSKQLTEATSEEARNTIIANTLGTLNAARVTGISNVATEKEKTKKTLLTVGIVAGTVTILGVLLIGKSNK